MGKMEKLIVIGALALVGFLLSVVLYKGLDGGEPELPSDPTLSVGTDYPDPALNTDLGASGGAEVPEVLEGLPVHPESQAAFSANPNAGVPESGTQVFVPGASEVQPTSAAPSTGVDLDLDGQPEFVEYTVKSGDTLEEIAKRELGARSKWPEILKFNETLDPKRMQVGQKIRIPASGRTSTPASVSSAVSSSSASGAQPAGARSHAVVAGDSLWKISVKYYGDGGGVQKIYEANKDQLASSDAVLRIGMQLRIP
ncbi:MAG: LysM peptidoglycan-binding domain-containing protein [Planctomycetota bacterium]|nr:MAG: LysM peptidoglycan-binding domain-containing protein [Planctomycetota bacterium]